MASIMTTMTAITEMVRGCMVAVLIDPIVGQPTLSAVRTLIEQLAAFASHFNTTTWGGRHSYLPLVLDQEKCASSPLTRASTAPGSKIRPSSTQTS